MSDTEKSLTLDDIDADDIEVMSSPEEIEQLRQMDQVGWGQAAYDAGLKPVQAMGMGMADSATIGFGDELLGGGAAFMDALSKGKPGSALMMPETMESNPEDLKEILKTYETVRDQARGTLKAGARENPEAMLLGQLVGGTYTPGFGVLGKGKQAVDAVKAATTASKLSPGLKTMLNITKDTAKGAAKGAATGAGYGGIYGAGSSEAEVLNGEFGALGKDVADYAEGGAKFGGALGGTIGAVTSSLTNGIGLMRQKGLLPEVVEEVSEAYKREKGGEKLVGTDPNAPGLFKDALSQQEISLDKLAAEIENDLFNIRNAAGKMQKGAFDAAEEAQITFNLRGLLEKRLQQAKELPSIGANETQKAGRQQLITMLEEQLNGIGQKTEVPLTSPQYLPGKTIPSGEEEAINKLKLLIGDKNIDNQLNVPAQRAEAKIRDKAANQELLATDEFTPYADPELAGTQAGPRGLTMSPDSEVNELMNLVGPEGMIPEQEARKLAQVIKDVNPADIKTITDPKTNQRFAVLFDENGSVIKKVAIDDTKVGMSKPEFIPGETKTVTQFPGGGSEAVSPSKLQELSRSYGQLGTFGEKGLKGEALGLANDINKDLKSLMTGTESDELKALVSGSMGEHGKKVADANKIIHAVKDAEEIMFPAFKGIDEAERVKINKSLSDTIGNLKDANGKSSRKIIREVLERLRETQPKLVDTIGPQLLDRATAYDLARTIKNSSPSRIVGWPTQIATSVGALAGRAAGTPSIAEKGKSLMKGATPALLEQMRDDLTQAGNVPDDLISKLDAASKAEGEKERQAMLFDIMQVPAYRAILGVSTQDES